MTATSFFIAVILLAVATARTLWTVARRILFPPRDVVAARHRGLSLGFELDLLKLALLCLLPSIFYLGLLAR